MHGNKFQKGIFQLRCRDSTKNIEFRKIVSTMLGIPKTNKDVLYIANYHWKLDLLQHLDKKYRTTLLPKDIAKKFNIHEKKYSFNKEGQLFYAIPNLTRSNIELEILSFQSSRSDRLRKRKIDINERNFITVAVLAITDGA